MKAPTSRINQASIQHNYSMLKLLSGSQMLIAVIKGSAYGHDALSDLDTIAVARIDEAIERRNCRVKQPILLLVSPC